MDNEKSKILMLVEGKKTDYKLMERLLQIYGISSSHQIVSYNTNIYTLYNEMFRDGDPESIDTLQNLKEHENDPQTKKLFDEHYSDILLIFDLDPQDSQFSPKKIQQMAEYFTESTEMGKLYLNYPMVEAFYHMRSIPDPDFYQYIASMDELRQGTYKQRVNKENRNRNYAKFGVTKDECNHIIRQNIEKAWMLAKKEADNDWLLPNASDILNAQIDQLREQLQISVLCTCVFYFPDFNPSLLD